jgi:hypothetical protein
MGLALFLTAPRLCSSRPTASGDLYVGRWIAARGIPHREVFAIANRGRPWTDQQWLGDLIGYQVWNLAGY